ncbi:mitochondrial import receptor subunit TOM22 homolog [Pectinophora gossypiella]|uniref:Mitochondrial import receptor subunit TOM22 homolog n=1 Tax=Pectinophora gossypiella TaxID=13191 RepID=A0A1E1WVD6_PECGO|nr:mitochondrial import receptor subunit TOM22 homolog [Pectinophora gossypiella]
MLMDLTDELEQSDSGMESLTASKDDTPERKPEDSFLVPATTDPGISPCLKEFDDEPDETFSERLWGLSEMFPDFVRNGTHTISTKTWSGVKSLYGLSRTVMWIIASSSVILFAPVIFEVERAQVEEMQKSQQKQVLLGTNTISNMPPMPR